MDSRYDGLQKIIDEALSAMAAEAGPGFSPEKANLAEFCRRTGLTRSKARTLRKKGFHAGPHGNAGRKAETTVLTGYTGVVDDQLRKGVTNSQTIFDLLKGQGYAGGITSVKDYIAAHRPLVPAPRGQADSRGPRGRRYHTEPGEAYQMDWGFANAEAADGTVSRIACFAMSCHHCGTPYIEFFPNARQENLFIGMLHGFMELGIPDWVLTDNMKSVVVRRDADGNPVWQKDYEAFMDSIGFRTRLCRPRHPWTKGKVERLIRFVKESFLQGREFTDITQLNEEARRWCREQSGRWRRAAACVPADEHRDACMQHARTFAFTEEAERWLCPKRKISFDGFVSYEGRRFGVPLWYARRECRVGREGRVLHIYSDDLSQELVAHPVTWDRHDSCCEGQWTDDGGPAEQPTQPPAPTVRQSAAPAEDPAFARFDFGRRA